MLKLRMNIDSEEAKRLLARAPEALHEALDRALARILPLFEARVKQYIGEPYEGKPAAVAQSTLVNAVFSEAEGLHGVVAVHPPADVYASAVETGARPHFPPVSALFAWVRKKFELKQTKVTAAMLTKRGGLARARRARKQERAIESAAYAVARAISKRGTRGHFMFERAFQAERANAETIVDAEIDSALQSLETE